MKSKTILTLAASVALLWASSARAQSDTRSAYSYVRETAGSVTVVSEYNGTVEARRNLPITAGDVVRTDDPGRAEVAMADGNLVQIGGGSELKFETLSGQQGSDDEVSALDLTEGSVILSVVGSEERSVPRIDTSDVTVYAGLGSRVRVNADSRRGTAVIVRAGSVEVRTRAGSYTVRAGNYLTTHGDDEPEIARGDFSRDRFDSWAADRLELNAESTRSASSRYVDEDYAGDVQSLDGYGDWEYNSTYSTNVWRPRVAAGWSPYSYGSWYYTPIGLTWWSWDPWGWYPFHYGNWFFDAGWNSWCWSPGYVYSPAWVYWGYSGNYFGWCPVGWYGGFSPWWDSYYRSWGWGRGNVCFAINGRFSTRRVDLRGWNFTNANAVGGRGRVDVIPGTRVVDRLGNDFSISSRPVVVQARGNVRDALREQIREAPRTIERTAGRDSERLAPVVAREAKLPASSIDALRERAVVAERGRLAGPGARDIAPRGATVVKRGNVRLDTSRGRPVITDRSGAENPATRGREAISPNSPDRGGRETRAPQPRSESPRTEPRDSWRGRPGTTERSVERPAPRESQAPVDREIGRRAPESRDRGSLSRDGSESWRGGTRAAPPREEPGAVQRGNQSWRSRSEVPPARRVIDGAVPGRRAPDTGSRSSESWRQAPPPRSDSMAPREAPRSREVAPRESSPPRQRDLAPREAPRPRAEPPRQAPPQQREFAWREAPRQRESMAPREAPRQRDFAPREAPRPREAPPSYRSAPRDYAPRDYSPRQAPRSFDRAPQSAPRSAPAPRFEPRSSSPRSAPAPSHSRPNRN